VVGAYTAYIGHTYTRSDGLSGVIMTDQDYPTRVVFTLLQKVLDEFGDKYPPSSWSGQTPFPPSKDYIVKYQDPKQADPIMRVQKDLDETKIILVCFPFPFSLFYLALTFSPPPPPHTWSSIAPLSRCWSVGRSWTH